MLFRLQPFLIFLFLFLILPPHPCASLANLSFVLYLINIAVVILFAHLPNAGRG